MKYMYGNFSDNQVSENAKYMHKAIHKLLCYKDKNLSHPVFDSDDDFQKYFENLLYRFGGLNELLFEPVEMVMLMSVLQAAYSHVNSKNFNYATYRRLILDAHGYISAIFEEV